MSFEYHYLQEEKPETDNKPKLIKKPKNSNKQTSTSTQDSSYSIDFSQICLLNNSGKVFFVLSYNATFDF